MLNLDVREDPPSILFIPEMERDHWKGQMEMVLVRFSKYERFGGNELSLASARQMVKELYSGVNAMIDQIERDWTGEVEHKSYYGTEFIKRDPT